MNLLDGRSFSSRPRGLIRNQNDPDGRFDLKRDEPGAIVIDGAVQREVVPREPVLRRLTEVRHRHHPGSADVIFAANFAAVVKVKAHRDQQGGIS